MLSILIICGILATASAYQLEVNKLKEFQVAVHGTILRHIQAEYKLLQVFVAHHNRSMDHCRTQLAAQLEHCNGCADRECPGEFGDRVEGVNYQGYLDTRGYDQGRYRARKIRPNKNVKDLVGSMADIGEGLINIINLQNFFSGMDDTLGSIGSFIGNGFNDLGNFMGSTFSDIGSGVLTLFSGRRRRDVNRLRMSRRLQMIQQPYMAKRMEEMSPEVRQCMEKCSECTPFLGDQTAMIAGVCGEQLVLDQRAIVDVGSRMKAFFDANRDPKQGQPPIIRMIEFDMSTCDSTFTCDDVYVTAVTPDGVVRYESAYTFNLEFPFITASEIALEIIEKWSA